MGVPQCSEVEVTEGVVRSEVDEDSSENVDDSEVVINSVVASMVVEDNSVKVVSCVVGSEEDEISVEEISVNVVSEEDIPCVVLSKVELSVSVVEGTSEVVTESVDDSDEVENSVVVSSVAVCCDVDDSVDETTGDVISVLWWVDGSMLDDEMPSVVELSTDEVNVNSDVVSSVLDDEKGVVSSVVLTVSAVTVVDTISVEVIGDVSVLTSSVVEDCVSVKVVSCVDN